MHLHCRYFRRVEMSPSPVLASSARSSSSRPTSAHMLRSQAEFEALFSCKAPAGKRYFQHTKLADIIGAYPVPSGLDDQQALEERQQREVLLDFLLGILDLDPDSRWTPSQALQHPFITQAPFTGEVIAFCLCPCMSHTVQTSACIGTAELQMCVMYCSLWIIDQRLIDWGLVACID